MLSGNVHSCGVVAVISTKYVLLGLDIFTRSLYHELRRGWNVTFSNPQPLCLKGHHEHRYPEMERKELITMKIRGQRRND